jgi:hypothetical protein
MEKRAPVLVQGFIIDKNLPSPALVQEDIVEMFKGLPIMHTIPTLPKELRIRLVLLRQRWHRRIDPLTIRLAYNTYLLPAEKVPEFQMVKREMREEYETLEKEIAEYLMKHTDFSELVAEAGRAYGKEIQPRLPRIADRFYANLIPLSLSPEFFEDYLEERARQAVKELDELKLSLLEEAKREAAAAREQMVRQAVEDIRERVDGVLRDLLRSAALRKGKKRISFIRKRLRDIEALAATCNIPLGERFGATLALADALASGDKEALETAASSVARLLGIPPTAPDETLARAAVAMDPKLGERLKALLAA